MYSASPRSDQWWRLRANSVASTPARSSHQRVFLQQAADHAADQRVVAGLDVAIPGHVIAAEDQCHALGHGGVLVVQAEAVEQGVRIGGVRDARLRLAVVVHRAARELELPPQAMRPAAARRGYTKAEQGTGLAVQEDVVVVVFGVIEVMDEGVGTEVAGRGGQRGGRAQEREEQGAYGHVASIGECGRSALGSPRRIVYRAVRSRHCLLNAYG